MDGILLPVKGKTARNLERVLNKPAPKMVIADEERARAMAILKNNKKNLVKKQGF